MKSLNILTATLIVVVAFVLIGQRVFIPTLGIGLTLAEGPVFIDRNGTDRQGTVSQKIRRGEIVQTGEDGRTNIHLGFGTKISLDENTDLRIDALDPAHPTATLLRGRIYIDTHTDRAGATNEGPLTLKTLRTSVTLPFGKLSLVNYDFKETLAVYPIDSSVIVTEPTGDIVTTSEPGELHETVPVGWTATTFDPTSGSAREFYTWAIR